MKKIILILNCVILFYLASVAQKTEAILKSTFSNRLKESSGIIVNKNGAFTFNDGVTNSIYKIDTLTGDIIQEIIITNTTFIDAEAITTDKDFLYIGDFGNNSGRRDNLNIIRVDLKSIADTNKIIKVQGDFIKFIYEDMEHYPANKDENNFDCEAMVSFKDKIILFTKRRGDNITKMYFLPKVPGNYRINPNGSFNCYGLITDAAISPDEKKLLLLGYEKGHEASFIWQFDDFDKNYLLGKQPKFIKLNQSTDEWQTEGICFITNNHVLITCEKTGNITSGLYSLNIK
jgi:hypothetical protein